MNKLSKWLKDLFDPGNFNDLDIASVASALNDSSTRVIWLQMCFEELREINMTVDKRLLIGSEAGLADLCARRKAYQDILEAVLTASRQVKQEGRPNPKVKGVNLDRVTA